MEKTCSAAADVGCNRSRDLQALDQNGSSLQ